MIVPRGWRTTTLRRFRRVSSAHPSRSVLQLASGASPPNMLPQSRAKTAHRPSAPNLCIRNCRWIRILTTPNLNHGQDTRANRTRHTTSSSTQSHAKRPLTSRRAGKWGRPPSAPASPIPHRPQCTGKPLEAHTRHTGRDITGTHQCCNTRFIGCARRFGRPHRRADRAPCVRVANSAAGRREPSWDRASSAAGSSPRRPRVEPGHAWRMLFLTRRSDELGRAHDSAHFHERLRWPRRVRRQPWFGLTTTLHGSLL